MLWFEEVLSVAKKLEKCVVIIVPSHIFHFLRSF